MPRNVRLHRLTVVVPKTANKNVLKQAGDSALSLRNKSLPFITPEFVIVTS